MIDEFRAAVLQHAIAVSVRQYKNEHGVTQDALGRLDGRPDATNKWNARLNGRIGLTMKDLAVLVTFLPGALPAEDDMRLLLDVAEKRVSPPEDWAEIDT